MPAGWNFVRDATQYGMKIKLVRRPWTYSLKNLLFPILFKNALNVNQISKNNKVAITLHAIFVNMNGAGCVMANILKIIFQERILLGVLDILETKKFIQCGKFI